MQATRAAVSKITCALVRGSCALWLFSTLAEAAVLPAAKAQYVQKIPGNNDGYYDDEEYVQNRVLGAAVIGIIIAIIACACGICFCTIQVCAKCCDCCKKLGTCCGADDAPPEGYTQNQRLCLVGVLFFGWVMIIAGSALGYSGNGQVADKLVEFADLSTLIAGNIYDQVKMGYDAADLVGSAPDVQMVTDAADLKKTVADAATSLKDSQELRILIVYIFYAVMMVVPLLGFAAWAMGRSCPIYIMTQISFCMLFFAWVFFGVTFAMGVILDDTCDNAGKHVYGQPNALSDLLECGVATSGAATYNTVWQKLDEVQAQYDTQGWTPAYPTEMSVGFTTNSASASSVALNSGRYSINRALLIKEYIDFGVRVEDCDSLQLSGGSDIVHTATTVMCYVPQMTPDKYQTVCMGGQIDALDKDCLQQGMILSTAGMTGSSYLVSCEHLNTLALALNNEVCNEMVDGLINVCIGQAFIGFFYFFVVIVGCMGMNRFHKDNYADNPAKVHPANQDIESGPPGGLQAQKQDVATPGQYSAEQAMAATRIQNIQRSKVAKKKVAQKRQQKQNAAHMYQ